MINTINNNQIFLYMGISYNILLINKFKININTFILNLINLYNLLIKGIIETINYIHIILMLVNNIYLVLIKILQL